MKKFICKYAGDREDEYCAVCDGITAAMADGESVPATQCPGFEPGETEITDTNAEPVNVEPSDEVVSNETDEVKNDTTAPWEPDEKGEEKPVAKAESVVEEKPKKPVAKKETKTAKKETKEPVKTVTQSCTDLGEIVEIRVDSGISFEATSGSWYKLNYGETRRVSGDMNLDAVREDMWNRANSEIDREVADIMDSVKTTK